MKPMDWPELPVRDALPRLMEALQTGSNAVLVAPPGAGKTTLVPPALLDAPWRGEGRILLLEPRRVAARAAARRMAGMLGEEPGQTIGYAMRMESRASASTRILVVTEGVLARMILDDPELTGFSAIIFDEFHERSLDGDFGLALALDIKAALRPDLRLLVMSATIDGARVARLLGAAPVIESAGRSFDVDIRYRERPAGTGIEDAMASAIKDALAKERGSVLAFLPGRGEIARTAERLAGRLPGNVDLLSLHGGLDGKAQDAAIRPAPEDRRKLVLATAIAETSITIDGVRVVIDSGLSRLPRFEPATGLTRLETARVSRASADQRAGRAGRTQPGIAIRLWRAEQTAALPAFTPPEILEADLSGLVLDAAAFGVSDPAKLAFLDPPPAPALSQARALLRELNAIDEQGRLTRAGMAMRRLTLPARLAHMVVQCALDGHAAAAAELAVLLSEQGLGGNDVDLDERLRSFRRDKGARAEGARRLAKQIARNVENGRAASGDRPSSGGMLVHAYPDRIAHQRGGRGRFVLSNGRGGHVDAAHALADAQWLVVADLQGQAREARIAAAAQIDKSDIRAKLGGRIETVREMRFDSESGQLRAREVERLGAIDIAARALPAPSGDEADAGLIAALRKYGLELLPWDKSTIALRQRLSWLHRGLGRPAMDEETLLAELEDWLLPYLAGRPGLSHLAKGGLREALLSRLPQDRRHRLDALAPTHFLSPAGNHHPIRYESDNPVLAIRVQELFGLSIHPAIADGTVPLTLELLSPAHRPIQTTRDLPGFWSGSWADVRAAMRGRYPKHEWPENPLDSAPTSRAKSRKA